MGKQQLADLLGISLTTLLNRVELWLSHVDNPPFTLEVYKKWRVINPNIVERLKMEL